jgi:hypothetical protein
VDEHQQDEPASGQLPGINGNPTGAGFRDAPRTEPRSGRALLLAVLPPLALAAVVLLVAATR